MNEMDRLAIGLSCMNIISVLKLYQNISRNEVSVLHRTSVTSHMQS